MTNNSRMGGAIGMKFSQRKHNRKILKVVKFQVPSVCRFKAIKKFFGGGGKFTTPPCRIGLKQGLSLVHVAYCFEFKT